MSNTTSTAETAPLAVSDNPQQATTASNDAALPPQAAVPAPQFVPFPCGKHLPLVPVEIEEQEPADSTAAATEQPKPRFAGAKNPPAPKAALSAPKAPRKPLQWIDASAAAAQEGDVCVCVASAGIERLSFSTGGKTTAQTSDTLVIHLQVILVGTSRKVDFTGWSNANFGDAQHKPSLFDGAKKPYRLQTFSRDARIVDHERPTGLYPKFYADDFLYFEVPAAHVESLRLELPESAFGGMNTIRFLIPGAMIDGRNETPPKT